MSSVKSVTTGQLQHAGDQMTFEQLMQYQNQSAKIVHVRWDEVAYLSLLQEKAGAR